MISIKQIEDIKLSVQYYFFKDFTRLASLADYIVYAKQIVKDVDLDAHRLFGIDVAFDSLKSPSFDSLILTITLNDGSMTMPLELVLDITKEVVVTQISTSGLSKPISIKDIQTGPYTKEALLALPVEQFIDLANLIEQIKGDLSCNV